MDTLDALPAPIELNNCATEPPHAIPTVFSRQVSTTQAIANHLAVARKNKLLGIARRLQVIAYDLEDIIRGEDLSHRNLDAMKRCFEADESFQDAMDVRCGVDETFQSGES